MRGKTATYRKEFADGLQRGGKVGSLFVIMGIKISFFSRKTRFTHKIYS